MAGSLPNYVKFVQPFAQSGERNEIPNSSSETLNANNASLELGFPPITSLPMSGGGIPPERKDFNGLGYLCTSVAAYLQQGGLFQFDNELSGLIGGYPQGAVLNYIDMTNGKVFRLISLIANNTYNYLENPDYIGQYWKYIDNNTAANTGRGIGDVFINMSSRSPVGALPLDGRTIDNCNSEYPAFWEWAKAEAEGGYIRVLTTAEYQSEISELGYSGAFVINESENSLTIPNFSNAFVMGQNKTNNGFAIKQSLPNIKGEIQSSQINNNGTTDGAFYFVKRVSSGAENYGGGSSHWIGFDASRSNTIYKDGSNVQPPAIATNYYIQVFDSMEAITNEIIASINEAIAKAQAIQGE